jgi:putative tryptophan/tyrosine transport system substrate-binding protein
LKRRNFILALGGAVSVWSATGRAQRSNVPIIGFLSPRSPDDSAHLVAAFRRGLEETGFTEGQNVSVEYRWALGEYTKLPMLAGELARSQIDVLVAVGGEPAVLAAKAATSTVPIVVVFFGDPV